LLIILHLTIAKATVEDLTKKKDEVDNKLIELNDTASKITKLSTQQLHIQQLKSTRTELQNQLNSTYEVHKFFSHSRMESLTPVFTEVTGATPDPQTASKQVENLMNDIKSQVIIVPKF
jgi:hypothetical protein